MRWQKTDICGLIEKIQEVSGGGKLRRKMLGKMVEVLKMDKSKRC